MKFYSAGTGGFYAEDTHGRRDQPGCLIPSDAVSLSDEEHAALLLGQSSGMRIVPDASGKPTLAEHVVSDDQMAAAARAERDQRLAATDWTQARDVSDATAAKWAPYRKALRDVPAQRGFPRSITWPVPPA